MKPKFLIVDDVFSALVTAIKEIKATALETKDARSGLSRIVRLCIDAEKASGTWTRIDRRSKHYGYNCSVCGDPIKEPQPTEHTDEGLAHAKCCTATETCRRTNETDHKDKTGHVPSPI